MSATRIYMVCIGFLVKIPLYQRFHTFFRQFLTFFHTLWNFHLYHIIRLLECFKNIYGLHRFPSENSSISAISHLFKAISHLFSHLFEKKISPYMSPNLYQLITKKIRQIKWIILEICFKKAKKAYFSHLFRHFWPNKIFSKKSGPVTF